MSVFVCGDEDFLAFVSFILSFMERYGREVIEVVVDFFLMMDVVGVFLRYESLCVFMYVCLMEVLLK